TRYGSRCGVGSRLTSAPSMIENDVHIGRAMCALVQTSSGFTRQWKHQRNSALIEWHEDLSSDSAAGRGGGRHLPEWRERRETGMATKAPAKLWQEMTTTDFAALDRERVVAVLPVGA